MDDRQRQFAQFATARNQYAGKYKNLICLIFLKLLEKKQGCLNR